MAILATYMRPPRQPPRAFVTRAVETTVLSQSRRRCCVCFYLHDINEVKKGQIAHLNKDRSDGDIGNLVYLCLDHHDEYDSRTSQAKGLTEDEVRLYREQLYKANRAQVDLATENSQVTEAANPILPLLRDESAFQHARDQDNAGFEVLNRQWNYPLWQVVDQTDLFAYKSHGDIDGVCLIERIDLPNGAIAIACIAPCGNPGQSITNNVELICFQVCERFNIPPKRLIWLEHYDYGDPEWNWVTFRVMPPDGPFSDPRWHEVSSTLWSEWGLIPKKKLPRRGPVYGSKLKKLFKRPSSFEDLS